MDGSSIEWLFAPLSALFQVISGRHLADAYIVLVSPVLGWSLMCLVQG